MLQLSPCQPGWIPRPTNSHLWKNLSALHGAPRSLGLQRRPPQQLIPVRSPLHGAPRSLGLQLFGRAFLRLRSDPHVCWHNTSGFDRLRRRKRHCSRSPAIKGVCVHPSQNPSKKHTSHTQTSNKQHTQHIKIAKKSTLHAISLHNESQPVTMKRNAILESRYIILDRAMSIGWAPTIGSSIASSDQADWDNLLTEDARRTGHWAVEGGKHCYLNGNVDCPEAEEWDQHWSGLKGSLRGWLFSQYRQHIRARCVAKTIRNYFTTSGTYVECGCGSSETSCRIIPKPGQAFLALDFASRPLRMALNQSCHVGGIQADIRQLPFRDHSLDGLWNLGVMEHFETGEQIAILKEFHRVLKPGRPLLLWWPPKIALDLLVLSPFGWGFPSEPGRIDKRTAMNRLATTGFDDVKVTLPIGDGWTQLLVTARTSSRVVRS